MPGIKPTQDEKRRRLQMVVSKLEDGLSGFKIKAYLMAEFGLSKRSAARYVSRARDEIIKGLGRLVDIKSEAYFRYLKIATDPAEKTIDRIRAQTRIDKLLGLDGPIRVQLECSESNEPDKDAKLDAELNRLIGILANPASGTANRT